MTTKDKINKSYMRNRYSSLLESKKYCDCSFIIDNEEIFAHKIILASSSSVFEVMFYGPFASSKINIEDISASDFKQLLSFIYTDAVKINSIANAWVLLYTAKKYLIDDFYEYCLNYIENHIEASSTLLSFEYAELFNIESLRERCKNNIQMYPRLVFQFNYHLKPTTFLYLLEQNNFNSSEDYLLSVLIDWVIEECQIRNINKTRDNLRSVLIDSGLLRHIRFLCMPLDSDNNNGDSKLLKILTEAEVNLLKACKTEENPENLMKLQKLSFCINKNPRNSISVPQKMCFRVVYKAADSIYIGDRNRLTFSTLIVANKYVLVNGFCIPQCDKDCFLGISVTVTDKVKNNVLSEFTVNENTVYSYGNSFILKSNDSIIFEEGQSYFVHICWDVEFMDNRLFSFPLYYMDPMAKKSDITFKFSDPLTCTGGGLLQGVCYRPF